MSMKKGQKGCFGGSNIKEEKYWNRGNKVVIGDRLKGSAGSKMINRFLRKQG